MRHSFMFIMVAAALCSAAAQSRPASAQADSRIDLRISRFIDLHHASRVVDRTRSRTAALRWQALLDALEASEAEAGV